MQKTIFFFCLLLGALFSQISAIYAENKFMNLKFGLITTEMGLSSNEVQEIYQDKSGYIWIATNGALCQYDGYQIKTYKSNLYTPDLFVNNNIRCLAEDQNQHLWVATAGGLNMMDKSTGEIKKFDVKELVDNQISKLLVSRTNKIFLGTEQGFCQYIPESNSCLVFTREITQGVMPRTAVKSLMEDSKGNIWIGTWSDGYYRYDPEKEIFYAYPRLNKQNSAHVIFEDSQKRIWIGTWGEGLCLLTNEDDPDHLTWTSYYHNPLNPNSISDDFIYDISEDLNTNTLWVGTRSGLSILPQNDHSRFFNFLPDGTPNSISYNEVNSILRDNQGIMWLGMLGGGVNYVLTRKSKFYLEELKQVKQALTTNSVRSLMVDNEGDVWMGIGSYGLVVQDRLTGKCTHNSQMADFAPLGKIATINTIMQSPTTGKIWLGTYGGGIYIYDKTARSGERVKTINTRNVSWLRDDCIYAIKEDRDQNYWIGTKYGLYLIDSKGKVFTFDTTQIDGKMLNTFSIVSIEEAYDGTIWCVTNNNGIIKLNHIKNGYVFKRFSPDNGTLNTSNTSCILEDSKNRLWVGTESGGLAYYNPQKELFVSVQEQYNIPGDAINSIQEDRFNNLWIGTNVGLIKLTPSKDLSTAIYRLYTTTDGLQDNIFNRRVAFTDKNGRIYFGGHKGYNSFDPKEMTNEELFPPIIITDIKFFNRSWYNLDKKIKNKISPLSPAYTHKIVLSHKQNNFNIEFASLSYSNPMQNKYAYKLVGFDKEWQYTDASRRFAYYNNLNSGKYKFCLKGTNENGAWNAQMIEIDVVILSPPWLTWWAYCLYFLSFVIVGFFIFRIIKNRIRLRNELHLRELEKVKSEEINHTKLQFFTNITHELLTPLTIISASVDELRLSIPQSADSFQIMTNNINRLIRLIQQILEFRKAETGNLKLKVSRGDLALFMRNNIDSFRPLMKKKNIHFSIITTPEIFPAYFDSDKMDKIFYNLLSNAAKYNKQGGTVWVELNLDETSNFAVIKVRDNGQGMSLEATKTLFQRFYEGDYRKYNTIGTGIGLSLTKDLVQLHGGTISVESEEGKGTQFTVVLPVCRESYTEKQIDDENIIISAPLMPIEEIEEKENIIKKEKTHTLLLLEDNEELLKLMYKLLSVDYNILTGTTGKDGIEIIEQEEVDLIVSDIMMPEMDGITFCKHVKSQFETSHIPVVLLTAKSREEDQVEAYDSGADGFVTKPFNLSVLHAKIGSLLRSRERVIRDFKKQLIFETQDLSYTTIDEEFIQKAINCVHENLSDSDFDQQKFIEKMGASKSTLYRKLKSLTGLNTSAFIRNIRLKAACQIMEGRQHIRISEIAYAVGFNDPKYFSACFKKEFGIHPSEYLDKFMIHAINEDEKDDIE